MAIDRDTTITFTASPDVVLTSRDFDGHVRFYLPVTNASTVQPSWGRYVAGVAAAMSEWSMAPVGFSGTVATTVPIGGGLSSSAALEVAAALAFGIEADDATIAAVCRRAEHLATNVPCGIMDQLTSAAGVKDHALMIDCHSLDITPIRIPDGVSVWVVPVSARTLDGSEYPTRVSQCAAAEREIGPLRSADLAGTNNIADRVIRARARHVVSENHRVRAFAAALVAGNLGDAGRIMYEGHRSLSRDFETSTPAMDEAVEQFARIPGVHGARMTGGGFGGCVVILADDDAQIAAGADSAGYGDAMRVRATDGASLDTPLS